MKKILQQLRSHLKMTGSPRLFILLFLIMAVSLAFNYALDFEDQYLDTLPPVGRWLGLMTFHIVPYLAICLVILPQTRENAWWRQTGFWLRLFLGFGVLAADRALHIQDFLTELTAWDAYYLARVLGRLVSLATMVLPLAIIYLMFDRDQPNRFYGLVVKQFDPRPYLLLLGFAALAILIGGAFRDIQEHYPRYLEVGGPRFTDRHDLPGWLNVLLYEAAYGVDFISVEMFFRGFLIFAFSRYLGPWVIYPMIATYCFLHFGKPLTESVSSLVGGYILGVIAINARTIWGGVMLHVGLAWLMELVGYVYRVF